MRNRTEISVHSKNEKCRSLYHGRSKGVGTTIGSILMIVTFLMFFGVFLYMANVHTQVNTKLNFESLQLLRLKSTFDTFNQSLGMTWYISTVQAIFKTVDDSVGCGIDDGRVPEGYWLSNDPSQPRTKDVIPTAGKYSTFGIHPSVCYPSDNDVTNYIRKTLLEGGYLNLENPVDVDRVRIALPINEETKQVDSSIQITLDDEGVKSKFTQQVKAEINSGTGTIDQITENFNSIETSLKQMVNSAKINVVVMLTFAESMQTTNAVTSYGPLIQNKDAYQSQIAPIIKGSLQFSTLPSTTASNVRIKTELNASSAKTIGVLKEPGSGLVLHYTATITYTDASTDASSSPLVGIPWPTASRRISSCYGPRSISLEGATQFHQGIDIAPNSETGEEIFAVMDGTVENVVTGCQIDDELCGGRAGNSVLINHGTFYSFYGHMESVSVQVGQNVVAGEIIGIMGNTGTSDGVHTHFEIRTDTVTRVNPCSFIDCSESTGEVCGAGSLLTDTGGAYYYHDMNTNTFTRRPISLTYSLQDYVPALDCQQLAAAGQPIFFNWQSSSDMACCAGFLFSCNADIPDLASSNSLVSGQSMSEQTTPQSTCNGRLSGQELRCTSSGFELV